METARPCHAPAECSNVPRANVYRRYGCAITRRTARRVRTSSSPVRRPTATTACSVAGNTSSTRRTAFRLIKNVIWLWIASMAVTKWSVVSFTSRFHLQSDIQWVSLAFRKCQPDDIHCGLPSNATGVNTNGKSADPCVPAEKKCDGYYDCRSGKDEEGCTGTSCGLDQFRCANGARCIEAALKCNHKNDCGDNSDEAACSKFPYLAMVTLEWRLFSPP